MKAAHISLTMALAILTLVTAHIGTVCGLPGPSSNLVPRREGVCCKTGGKCRFYANKKDCSIYPTCPISLCQ